MMALTQQLTREEVLFPFCSWSQRQSGLDGYSANDEVEHRERIETEASNVPGRMLLNHF